MSAYQAPLKDMRFVLNELAGLAELAKLPGYQDATPDTVDAILEEASKFASGVLDPINYSGDQEGSKWADGAVRTPNGFPEAYKQFCEGGWNALPTSIASGDCDVQSCGNSATSASSARMMQPMAKPSS